MFSFPQVELASLSAAALFETALLLALVERRNWSRAPLPIVLLLAGGWMWHAGSLGERIADSAWGVGSGTAVVLRLVMATGLMMIPSAMLHAWARLRRSGLECGRPPEGRYATLYLPMLMLLPIGVDILSHPESRLTVVLMPWLPPYSMWAGIVNLGMAASMWKLWRSLRPEAERFLKWTAGVLVATVIVQWIVVLTIRDWPHAAPWMILVVSLTPVVPAALFAYFVSQFNVMQLALERSVIYATLLAAAWLVHRILFAGLRAELADRFRLDLEILEVLVLAAIVLCYPPARRRTAEALRYLFGSRVDRTREGLRQISLDLAAHGAKPPREVLAWFAEQLREELDVEYVAIWHAEEPATLAGPLPAESRAELAQLAPRQLELLAPAPHGWATRRQAPNSAVVDALDALRASLFVRLAGEPARLLVVGRRSRNRNLVAEEVHAVVLVAEQLLAVLAAGRLAAERAEAERRAMQNERLTLLGLLASSIAHEVKNPLSSIRTIASVLQETLGPQSPHAEDLRLIVGESERLHTSVEQLLAVVRQPRPTGPVQAETVLGATLDLVRFVARDRGVSLAAEIAGGLRPVKADEGALREIFLNLLTNSIEAAGDRGSVQVDCRQRNGHVVASFRDNGPGLAAEVRERLFQPFVTTKPEGTGLGLFIASQRVRECGGEIACQSEPGAGTSFTVELPCTEEPTPA